MLNLKQAFHFHGNIHYKNEHFQYQIQEKLSESFMILMKSFKYRNLSEMSRGSNGFRHNIKLQRLLMCNLTFWMKPKAVGFQWYYFYYCLHNNYFNVEVRVECELLLSI